MIGPLIGVMKLSPRSAIIKNDTVRCHIDFRGGIRLGEKPPHTLPEIRKSIVLNAPISKVWEAVATSGGIAAWWMPNTFEPVLGRDFILHTGQFGDSPCKVTELDLPNKIGFDWDEDWHVVFELKELEYGKTEFTLIHSGWNADKVTKFGQPHSIIRDIMDNGWEPLVKEKLVAFIEA